MSARERILDVYEAQLIDHSERGATLEAIAERAGVSKGGLLYHFPSKDALADALIARLTDRADGEGLPADPLEAALLFVRSAADLQEPASRTYLAVQILAQLGREPAAAALQGVESRWYGDLAATIGDPVAARALQLIADGIYNNASSVTPGLRPTADGFRLVPGDDELVAIVRHVLRA